MEVGRDLNEGTRSRYSQNHSDPKNRKLRVLTIGGGVVSHVWLQVQAVDLKLIGA